MRMDAINLQALLAVAFFVGAAAAARAVANIYRGKWRGGPLMLAYLRALVGFLLAVAVALSYYAFAGIDVITGRM
jgi:ABC-type multidrug transport system permease subunit